LTIEKADAVVARFAKEFGGPFTHEHARRAGLSQEQIEQRVRAGFWLRLHPRVYVHAATSVTGDVQRRAALQWAGTGAVLSHRSAGVMWGFDSVVSERPELTVISSRHRRSSEVIVHRSDVLDRQDRGRITGVTVTSPTRTIIDLASVLSPVDLRVAFESARRERHTTVKKVRNRLEAIGGSGRPGTGKLRVLLDQLDGQAPSEYPLEVRIAQLLAAAATLDAPVRQYVVRAGPRAFRLDFAWPSRRLALECDGRLRHSEDGDFARDRERWSALAAIGWRLLFATWADVTRRPDELLARLQLALAA
jgi:hypothetical protein